MLDVRIHIPDDMRIPASESAKETEFGAVVVVWIGEAGADAATVTVDTYEG